MSEVTLLEVLETRERRVATQERLRKEYAVPILSFCMNIAGPVKDSPLIRRGFSYGLEQLMARFEENHIPVLKKEIRQQNTGPEAFIALEASQQNIKKIALSVEDQDPVGRLFDMDVINAEGEKVDRTSFGLLERPCLVCGAIGKGCSSRRLHSVTELQEKTRVLLEEHFRKTDPANVASHAVHALNEEVRTTPKPGLVDRNNQGSHTDMDLKLFLQSAAALAPYFEECVRIGMETQTKRPEETFALLRIRGQKAEETMFQVTKGVNTHKGAIFLLGTLCGAVGRLSHPERPETDPIKLMNESRAMARQAMLEDLAKIIRASTHGEQAFLSGGLRGARGELADGFPTVRKIALPIYQSLIDQGAHPEEAGSLTLLAIIAEGTDTNLYYRGGKALAEEACQRCKKALTKILSSKDQVSREETSEAILKELDAWFIDHHLSPGGSADLLAVCYFLSALEKWSI